MNNAQFSLANRKQLADLLADKYQSIRYRAKEKYDERDNKLRESIIKEFAEKKGALKVYNQIEAAKEQIEEWEEELSTLGFAVAYGGDLGVNDGALMKTVNARILKDIGTKADIDARFDSVQIAMMTVASLEDAEKLLKSVSEI